MATGGAAACFQRGCGRSVPSRFVKGNFNHDARGRFARKDGGAAEEWLRRTRLRAELKARLSKYKGVGIVNESGGAVAMIAKRGIEKIGSDKAIAKSVANGFTVEEHFEMARSLPLLFRKSKFKGSKADERSGCCSTEIERYLSPAARLSTGKRARAYITVKWTRTINGRRIYTMEAVDIKNASAKKAEAGARPLPSTAASVGTSPSGAIMLDSTEKSSGISKLSPAR